MRTTRLRRLGWARTVGTSAALLLGMTLTAVNGTASGSTLDLGVASPVAGTTPLAAVSPTSGRPFTPGSPFNQPIGSRVSLDPRSADMVRVLAGRGYATAQVYADTPPVFDATSSTPRYRVSCTEAWGTCDLERQPVPIPAGAAPSPGYDKNMVVVDWSTRRVFEFWQYRNDRARTAWGAVCSLDGTGTGSGSAPPCRAGATGSGISRLAGVIRTHEVRQGRIDHALVGYTGNSCSRYRYPAVKSDGWSQAGGCIPEGARVQLSPSVRCSSLPGIRPWEVTVCRALQRYGWYNIDNGGPRGAPGFGVQFENPRGEADPYRVRGLYDYTQITHIPLGKLRVLRSWNSSW